MSQQKGLKPPFAYAGGKSRNATTIAAFIGPHEHYVEPFAGSLAVLFAKPASRQETVNDLDGEIVNLWRMLRDQPDELIRRCELTPHAREEFELALQPSDDPVEQARRTWIKLTQSMTYSGVVTKGNWGNPGLGGNGTSWSWPMIITNRNLPRMRPVAERLRRVAIEHRDALDLLRIYDAPTTCFYLDPPYQKNTHSGSTFYPNDTSDELHAKLVEILPTLKGQVILSGYDNPLYNDVLTSWHKHAMRNHNRFGDARQEMLWINRLSPATVGLFDEITPDDKESA